MSPIKVQKLCDEGHQLSSKQTRVLICQDLGANTSLIEEHLRGYSNFVTYHKKLKGKYKTRWFYDRCYVPLLEALGGDRDLLGAAPVLQTKQAVHRVVKCKKLGERNTVKMWVDGLIQLDAHTELVHVARNSLIYASGKHFWEHAKTFCIYKEVKTRDGNLKRICCPVTEDLVSCPRVIDAFASIKPLLIPENPRVLPAAQERESEEEEEEEEEEEKEEEEEEEEEKEKVFEFDCEFDHDISLDRAVSIVSTSTGRFMPPRVVALIACGFTFVKELKEAFQKREKDLQLWKSIYEQMPDKFGSYTTWQVPFMQVTCGGRSDILIVRDMEGSELMNIIDMCAAKPEVYRLLMFLATDIKAKEYVDIKASWFVTKQSIVDIWLTYSSPWRRQMFGDAMKEHRERVQKSSIDPRQRYIEISRMAVSHLRYLEEHAAIEYAEQIPLGADPIRWFLGAATEKMLKKLFIEYGNAYIPDNSKVKSTHNKHHAQYVVTMFIRLITKNIGQYLTSPCQNITFASLKGYIPNRREVYQGNTRTFTTVELDRMEQVAKEESPLYLILIILLRQVALRVGCLARIKFYDLYNGQENHAKPVVSVIEKNNKVRTFPTSKSLQTAIHGYKHFLDVNYPHVDRNRLYIFNPQHVGRPISRASIRRWLKKIGNKADVSKVVYPHVFRHTLVGHLYDQGNDIATISKVMDHESVDVTYSHYLLKSVKDLQKDINSDYYKTKYTTEELEDEHEQEIKRLKEKVDAMLEIFNMYNTVIAQFQDTKTGNIILDQIHKKIPNLQMLVDAVASNYENSVTTSALTESDMMCVSDYEEEEAQ